MYTHNWIDLYIYVLIEIDISTDGYLDCFHVLALASNATMNVGVHVSFQISGFVFFSYVPNSGIAGSYGNSIFSF